MLDAVSIEGRSLVVTTPAKDRRIAGGVALACGLLLLSAGEGIAAIAALPFLLGGAALVLHRGLRIAFDTEQGLVRIGVAWHGGGMSLESVPFGAVEAIGLRQATNGSDGAAAGYLAELRLADGRVVWLLPSSTGFVEGDALLETIREATGLTRRDDPRPSPFA
jgi:hypothetical protein